MYFRVGETERMLHGVTERYETYLYRIYIKLKGGNVRGGGGVFFSTENCRQTLKIMINNLLICLLKYNNLFYIKVLNRSCLLPTCNGIIIIYYFFK